MTNLMVTFKPIVLETDKLENNQVNESVINDLTDNLILKLQNMSFSEKLEFFNRFSVVKDNYVDNVKVGDVIKVDKLGDCLVIKVNKKTVNIITLKGSEYSCPFSILQQSDLSLKDFMNNRTYSNYNHLNSGCFYEVKSKNGFEPCLLIVSGNSYKMFSLSSNLSRFFRLKFEDLSNDKVCKLIVNKSE